MVSVWDEPPTYGEAEGWLSVVKTVDTLERAGPQRALTRCDRVIPAGRETRESGLPITEGSAVPYEIPACGAGVLAPERGRKRASDVEAQTGVQVESGNFLFSIIIQVASSL